MSRSSLLSAIPAFGLCYYGATFVPTGARQGVSMLRGADATVQGQSVDGGSRLTGAASSMGVAAAAAAGVMATAAVCSSSRVARRAYSGPIKRRPIGEALEDAGINLMDNGKFAQGLIGSEHAYGRYEFDPIGFSKLTEALPFFREAELKHGRIAMLAWVGLVVPDFVRVPGDLYSFESVPSVLQAHDELNGPIGVNFQILVFISIVELCTAKKVFEWNSLETAGDYGLTWGFPEDEEGQIKKRIAELKNGRLAMIAFGGAITQAVITQNPFPWLY